MSELSLRLASLGERLGVSVQGGRERTVVPGRIMAPRILFLGSALGLVVFGLLMIYSSSSIVGLTSKAYDFNPAYFLVQQLKYCGLGLLAAAGLAYVDYHVWHGTALKVIWGITLALLVLVFTPVAGQDAYGASRWIAIGSSTLQPSEFAKITIVLTGANIAEAYFAQGVLDSREAGKLALAGIALPLALVLLQPDKGTTGVIVATLAVMVYLAGVPGRSIVLFAIVGLAAALIYALKDEYSRARIMTVFDPFNDEYGAGYQIIQGFYALGSGGLTGVGLGLSRQKYNYLPMAYNDFILAVVGEELGFLGVAVLLAAFCLLLWAGLKIAENAPDLMGRLIAAGCTSLLIIQLLLNVSGVLGIFPLSGKPVPFISYGGSSIVSSLMLVGLVVSVSLRSTLPQTRYDERRAQLKLAGEPTRESNIVTVPTRGAYGSAGNFRVAGDYNLADANNARGAYGSRGLDGSTAGRAMPRSASLASAREPSQEAVNAARARLRIVEDGSSGSAKLVGRVTVDARGRRRIDLGPSAAERLRGRKNER